MATISAIEISGEVHSAVIAELDATGTVRVLSRVDEPGTSLRVPSLLFDAASAAGMGPRDLGMIALGYGPSDPGRTRLAMNLMRAYAAVTKAPLVAVSAVEALAFEACASAPIGAVLVPAIALPDGRVATATFGVEEDRRLVRVAREANLTLREWIKLLTEAKPSLALGFGTGYAAYRDRLLDTLPELGTAPSRPSAFGVALAAAPLARGARARASP